MKKILLFLTLCLSLNAYATTYESENGNACLSRDDITGNLIPHLMSETSGIFSNTNKCWYQASGDIKILTYQGTTVVYATWVPMKYINFEEDKKGEDNEQLSKPDGLLPNTNVEAKLAFNYYSDSRTKYCNNNSTTVCTTLACNDPSLTMKVSELKCNNNYYTCYVTNTDYPNIGNATCTLKDGYFIDGTRVRSCLLYPDNPACQTGTGNDGDDSGNNNNNNSNNSGSNENNSNTDLTGIAQDITKIKENTEKIMNSVEESLTVSHSILDESQKISSNTELLVETGIELNDKLTQIESHADKLTTSNDALLTQAGLANNTLSNIYYSSEDILMAVNGVRSDVQNNSDITKHVVDKTNDIATSNNALLSETQKQHSDINANHNELINKLDNLSIKSDIGEFSSNDNQELSNTFSSSTQKYEDDSYSLVKSALSALSNNIPDLSIMFKLPTSFYGDSYGICKPLNTKLDFNFPFSPKTYSMQFSTALMCQHYDSHFRGMVDFLFAFLTALAVFRLYHRYSSSH